MRRRIKQVPLAFYRVTPNSLFSESDFPGWSFEDSHSDTLDGNVDNGAPKTVEKDDAGPVKKQRVESA